mmetsp:Transcript_25847/g.79552  ORF Transcript_25847/g.79552 Transcript_25847/m.79552 type:complete len:265 (-) Transcript_25847:520-1314(-)
MGFRFGVRVARQLASHRQGHRGGALRRRLQRRRVAAVRQHRAVERDRHRQLEGPVHVARDLEVEVVDDVLEVPAAARPRLVAFKVRSHRRRNLAHFPVLLRVLELHVVSNDVAVGQHRRRVAHERVGRNAACLGRTTVHVSRTAPDELARRSDLPSPTIHDVRFSIAHAFQHAVVPAGQDAHAVPVEFDAHVGVAELDVMRPIGRVHSGGDAFADAVVKVVLQRREAFVDVVVDDVQFDPDLVLVRQGRERMRLGFEARVAGRR